MDIALSRQRHELAARLSSPRIQFAVLAGFAATLFLSALLLFSVQPMFAKMVLPQLGGSPSVWAVSTCFFQAVLFAGYLYAHLLNRFVDPRHAPLIHLGVLALAFVALPVGLPANLSTPPNDGAYLWLTAVLASGVGLPFFAVSATAPLMQAWFSRTGNDHAKDPYFLYGASNLGSLLALLGYPVIIEPFLGLQAQSSAWTKGFLLLAAAIAAAGLVAAISLRARGDTLHKDASSDSHATPLAASQRLRWILFAAVPSGLLVAVTTHLSTDIAAAPFLWVIPLALFLLTFVVVFRQRSLVSHAVILRLQPFLVAIALLTLSGVGFDAWQSSLAAFAAFLATTLAAHRELFQDRPSARHLTAFYLWMSFGGVIGGLFAAIIAPQVFRSTYEFPLLLTLGLACRTDALRKLTSSEFKNVRIIAAATVATIAMGLLIGKVANEETAWKFGTMAVLLGSIGILLARQSAKTELAIIAAMSLTVVMLPSSINRGDPSRSFFGVLRVVNGEDGALRLFMHGTTSHGAQRMRDKAGAPILPPVPATYYHPGSAMARALTVARDARPAATDKPFSVGVIGLGIGSMACYAKHEESWRFYEIDAEVVRIARDPSKFNFLSSCRPNADIVLGDGRLTIASERPGSFDYLQVDAFSSDSVPMHLLTLEAMRLYLDKLTQSGVLAVHVSNKHLDLAPVAVAAALASRDTHVAIAHTSADKKRVMDVASSTVVLVTKSPEVMARIASWPEAQPQTNASVPAWTDDYSDIVSALWRVYGEGK